MTMREKVSELSVLLDKQGGSRTSQQGTEIPTLSCLTLSPEFAGRMLGLVGEKYHIPSYLPDPAPPSPSDHNSPFTVSSQSMSGTASVTNRRECAWYAEAMSSMPNTGKENPSFLPALTPVSSSPHPLPPCRLATPDPSQSSRLLATFSVTRTLVVAHPTCLQSSRCISCLTTPQKPLMSFFPDASFWESWNDPATANSRTEADCIRHLMLMSRM